MSIMRRELRRIIRDISNAQSMIEAMLLECELSEPDMDLMDDVRNKLIEAEQMLDMVEL